jgi:hypothetical protein
MQYESMQKYLQCDYEFVVFNNAVDNEVQYEQIKKVCNNLNIKCVDIKLDTKMQVTQGVTNFIGNRYTTPNVACSYPLMWSFKHYVTNEKKICIIDSDMFFIDYVDLEKLIVDKDVVYIPQYRQNHQIHYMWNAFVILNLEKNPDLKNLEWTPAPIHNENMDVGALTHFYLKNKMLNFLLLEEHSIRDEINNEFGTKIHYILNGNINYHLDFDKKMNLVDFKHTGGQKFNEMKSFPYEKDYCSYDVYTSDMVKKILSLIKEKKANLPDPYHIAFIAEAGSDKHFILHYKSGSNYLSFTTETYNKLKTIAVKKILS